MRARRTPLRARPARALRAFRGSPYHAATVIALILAVGAGVFAGTYTSAMANPTPHRLPVAVVGAPEPPAVRAYAAALERRLHTELEPHRVRSYAQAVDAVEGQRVFAVLRERGDGVELGLASASGASVAELLTKEASAAARDADTEVRVSDIKPLQPGDPRGLALFYVSLAAVIVGFLGAIQLTTHAGGLTPGERMGFTALYAVLGGFAICAAVDWLLGAVRLPFAQSWAIISLTMFAAGMVHTMFHTLIGRWALLPTWGLMVVIGNPSSGGAVAWPLLPSALGTVGRWLPPGASVNAQHSAVYFPGHEHPQPYLVLAGWAVLASAVFWALRHRAPGDPARWSGGADPARSAGSRDPG